MYSIFEVFNSYERLNFTIEHRDDTSTDFLDVTVKLESDHIKIDIFGIKNRLIPADF